MDRRSWLWRRKSSEKSPGETESSGSISSLSERFSDDQAVYQCFQLTLISPILIPYNVLSSISLYLFFHNLVFFYWEGVCECVFWIALTVGVIDYQGCGYFLK